MYLNGNRLKEAARLRKMTKAQLQKKSGIDEADFEYYWHYPITVSTQEHRDALAKALGIKADLLEVPGEPDGVTLRPDKFVGDEGGIEWIKPEDVKRFKS